jgi:secreted PhoX family phosphatase
MKTRREFLQQAMAVSVGFAGLNRFLSIPASAGDLPLLPAEKWLELPAGFNARVISKWGDKMSDGFFVPGKADGMAAFDVKGKVVLIRNHENNPKPAKYGPYGEELELFNNIHKNNLFDYGYGKTPGLGGTTTLVYDEKKQVVERQFLSLAGTYRNCAGGPTPWGSWITCEEDTTIKNSTAETNHGYNFEVPASNTKLLTPVPLKDMGRFNHEAVCVDPATGIVYQTEDAHDSLIYRFIPKEQGKLHKGGTLQALAVREAKGFDTRNWNDVSLTVGQSMDVEWIGLSNVDTNEDDLRLRGHALGAALFARGEGMWFGNKEVFFACTNGGKKKMGQIFRYVPSTSEGTGDESNSAGKLTLFAESDNLEILKFCDNLTVAPWGDVILVEDAKDSFIRGITPSGKIYNIGTNVGSSSEMAGVCFSPSGKTLFVNIQEQGVTIAIDGPWTNFASAAR